MRRNIFVAGRCAFVFPCLMKDETMTATWLYCIEPTLTTVASGAAGKPSFGNQTGIIRLSV